MIIRKLKYIYLPHETSESVLKVPHQKTFFSAPTTNDDSMREILIINYYTTTNSKMERLRDFVRKKAEERERCFFMNMI